MRASMIIYTCNGKDGAPLVHGCARSLRALRAAGHEFEHRTVGGARILPWTLRHTRDDIQRLSGQRTVPILLPDGEDGECIVGSKAIVAWAQANAAG
jgi:hypothetical protein